MRTIVYVLAAVCLVVFAGCPKPEGPVTEPIPPEKDFGRELGAGEFALRKITNPADIPDFTVALGNTQNLREAVNNSLDYLAKPSSSAFFPYPAGPGTFITRDQEIASLKEFLAMLDTNAPAAQLNGAIRQRFDVYTSVGWDKQGGVLFTGYYTPIFDASPTPTDKFKYPIFKQPPDLHKDPGGAANPRYYSREQIEKGNLLAGQELFYLGDPFEVYIAHVQGSAKLRMPDGNLVTVGYTAVNGYDYKSVGKILIAEGKMSKEGLSLQAMIDYFKKHPQDIQKYTWQNPRFVFFALNEGEARGCLNEPVTTMRTVAADKAIFPRSSLCLITTKLPQKFSGQIQKAPYSGFALDQDAGGAIRAPGRCDVYMGVGDEAGKLAGQTYEEGRLYYLFLKPELVKAPALAPSDSAAPAPKATAVPKASAAPAPAK